MLDRVASQYVEVRTVDLGEQSGIVDSSGALVPAQIDAKRILRAAFSGTATQDDCTVTLDAQLAVDLKWLRATNTYTAQVRSDGCKKPLKCALKMTAVWAVDLGFPDPPITTWPPTWQQPTGVIVTWDGGFTGIDLYVSPTFSLPSQGAGISAARAPEAR